MADLPEGFDLEALLAPIPGDAPQGIDIREDMSSTSPYNRLRDARSDARDAERGQDRGEADTRDPTPLWRTVREVAVKTLTETSKDLEVAAWMTEALVRSHSLAGLTAGAQVMAGLAENYWDGLFPLPDDYGMETRVAPVTGLNGRDGNGSLIQPLHMTTLFNRPDGSPMAYYQFRQSEQLSTLDAERRQQRIAAGTIPFEDLEREARAAGAARFGAVLADARAARDAWQAMADIIDARAGDDGPSTTAVRDLVSGIIEIVSRYAPADAAGTEAAAPVGEAPATPASGVLGRIAVSPGQIASREDALRALGQIADFFRRSEPHSPLSYTLDEAVRRGRMTWPELLAEVVADTDTRNTILNTLGIRPPPPEASE
jgi:type VI secretion system protein ImpA